MAAINLYFETAHDEDLDHIAQSIEARLNELEMVEEADAIPVSSETLRGGLEIAAAIGATVLIIRSGRELVEEIRNFLKEIKGFVGELRDLKEVYVDWRGKRKPLEELEDADIEELARQC